MLKRSRDYGLYLTPWAMPRMSEASGARVNGVSFKSPRVHRSLGNMAVHLATTVVVLSLKESPLLEGAERKQDKSLRPTYFRSRETALSVIVVGVNVVYPSLGW